MAIDVVTAAEQVLLGEAIASVARHYREQLLADVGLDEEDATPATFRKETTRFINGLCRHLAERHPYDTRVSYALRTWVTACDEFDAYDALLTTFRDFEGRPAVLRRGQMRFPRALTSHWSD